jgi:hypothetical protein
VLAWYSRIGKQDEETNSVRFADIHRHGGLPRVANGPEANLEPHLLERVHHRLTHVIRDDGLDMVVKEESSDTGVMGAFSSLVVEGAPPDVELLPVPDPTRGHVCNRHPIRATPARVDQAISGYGNANHHFS